MVLPPSPHSFPPSLCLSSLLCTFFLLSLRTYIHTHTCCIICNYSYGMMLKTIQCMLEAVGTPSQLHLIRQVLPQCVCVCVCVCARACVRACVRVCVCQLLYRMCLFNLYRSQCSREVVQLSLRRCVFEEVPPLQPMTHTHS